MPNTIDLKGVMFIRLKRFKRTMTPQYYGLIRAQSAYGLLLLLLLCFVKPVLMIVSLFWSGF